LFLNRAYWKICREKSSNQMRGTKWLNVF
jgi:hypothetical protein